MKGKDNVTALPRVQLQGLVKRDLATVTTPKEIARYARYKADHIAQISDRSGVVMTAIVQQSVANALEEAFREGMLSVRKER